MSAPTAARFTPAEIAEAVAKRVARVGDFDENVAAAFAQHGIELDDDGFTLTRGGQDFFVAIVDLDAATGIEKLAEDELKISSFSVRATVDGDTPSVEIGGTKVWSRGLVYLSPADARATALAMLEMADVAEKAVAR
jgi:hypothetical protein